MAGRINTLGKGERLKSRKVIDALFSNGRAVHSSLFKTCYAIGAVDPEHPLRVGVGVSARKFKKAVERNRIKRLTREALRLQKHSLENSLREQKKSLSAFFLYTGREMPDFATMMEKVGVILRQLESDCKDDTANT
jgi:ribonuclease P protein component